MAAVGDARELGGVVFDERGGNEYTKDLSDIDNLSKRVNKLYSVSNAFFITALVYAVVLGIMAFFPGAMVSLASKVMAESTAILVFSITTNTISVLFFTSVVATYISSIIYSSKLNFLSKKAEEVSIKSLSKMNDLVERIRTVNTEIPQATSIDQIVSYQQEIKNMLIDNEKALSYLLLVNKAISGCVKYNLSSVAKENISTSLLNEKEFTIAQITFEKELGSSIEKSKEARAGIAQQ